MAYQPAVRSKVDTINSTQTPLGIAGNFTGDWTDVTLWGGLSVLVDGTSASTAPGTLRLQFSHDGSTVNRQIEVAVADVASAPPRTLGVVAQYFRVVYENGGVEQTTFDLQTILHETQVSLVSRLDQDISANEDVTNVRAVSTGQQPDGDYVNARADGTGFTTDAVLGPSATYESPWVDSDGYNGIDLFIGADQPSAQDGVEIEFTDDVQAGSPTVRATQRYTFTQTEVDRGFLRLFFQPTLDGFRVRYTNGITPQGSFFLQSDLRVNRDAIPLDSSGAVIVGDFGVEVALGNVPNVQTNTKFGAVRSIDSVDVQPRTVWRLADDGSTSLEVQRKTFATTAADIYMASDNAADTGIEITAQINDANNQLVTVTGTLNGTDARTPVLLYNTGGGGLDCNIAFVSGDDQTLAGDVYITQNSNYTDGVPDTGTEVLAFIPQADQRTQQATYRVPAGKTLVLNEFYTSLTAGTANGSQTINLRVKPEGGSWYTARPYQATTAQIVNRDEAITLAAGSFIEVTIADTEGNDLNTLVIFNYNLVTV